MFGSIAAKSIDNRPPLNPAKALDPWDDTSLIQFWQQSIGSYKKHHAGPDTIDEKGPDPLVERTKRMDSSIPDDQTTRTKRARKDTVDPTTTAATDNLPSIPAQTTQNTSSLLQDKDDNDDDDDDIGPDQVVEEEYGEGYTKAAENQEHNEDYYNESSYDYNYDYYYHNNNDYAYQQPQAAAPPPMPFAPPASASPEGNEAFTNMIMAWYYSGYYTGLYQTMKFAKQMETEATELPVNWRPYLIKYRSLKKSLHSVVEELQSRGLSLQLLSDQRQENWSLVYAVTGDTKNQPRPCIKIRVDNPASFSLDDDDIMHQVIPSILATNATNPKPFQYQIDLIKDMEFFRLLLAELEQALTLYDVERQRLLSAVKDLEDLLTVAASPTKKDLYIWREIFHLYLSICPSEKTTQDYEGCKERLALLSNDIVKRKLDKKLSSCRSKAAFGQFFDINHQLNIFQHFQLLNTTAMTKILKKHDKRSGLTAMSEFPTFAKDNLIFLREIDAALFQIIRSKITTIVPQPDDYSCPVCYGITWRPIRLECNHVFCVRCLIKAHRKRLYDCPLCRLEMAVGNADANNLDKELQDFLLLYFPREIKEKRRDNEQEQADLVGATKLSSRRLPAYNRTTAPFSPPPHHSSNCSIM